MTTPAFITIKNHIIHCIESCEWQAGDRVPSENALAQQFSVSRMTARRALQELDDEGIVVRTQGLGSFVADARPRSSILEIHSIDQEIQARGHGHSARVIKLSAASASKTTAQLLGLKAGADVFHSIVLHLENGIPLQYEERHINPDFGPDYLQQDFSVITPNHYLSRISPLTEADQTIEAILVDHPVADMLDIRQSEPCLRVSRRTWCQRGIVNFAHLIYPGSRYRLGEHLNF